MSSNNLFKDKITKKLFAYKSYGLVWFYGIPTFVGYLMPNPFLYKQTVLFQIIQFSISAQFICQNHFYFKLFSFVKQF